MNFPRSGMIYQVSREHPSAQVRDAARTLADWFAETEAACARFLADRDQDALSQAIDAPAGAGRSLTAPLDRDLDALTKAIDAAWDRINQQPFQNPPEASGTRYTLGGVSFLALPGRDGGPCTVEASMT